MLAIQSHSRRGATLLELIVTIALITLSAGVVGLALPDIRLPIEPRILARISAAQRNAARSGSPVTIRDTLNGQIVFATAMPDGRMYVDSALHALSLAHSARTDQ